MKPKQHAGVRRSPVPGKICFPYVTGHRQLAGKTGKLKSWLHKETKRPFRPKREEKKLREFLLAYAKPSRAKREHYEFVTGRKAPKPLTKKEREAWAKKALAQIKGRGLPDMQMFIFADEFDEWWNGQEKYVMEGGKWSEKREKGEKHRRAKRNLRKANNSLEEKKRQTRWGEKLARLREEDIIP